MIRRLSSLVYQRPDVCLKTAGELYQKAFRTIHSTSRSNILSKWIDIVRNQGAQKDIVNCKQGCLITLKVAHFAQMSIMTLIPFSWGVMILLLLLFLVVAMHLTWSLCIHHYGKMRSVSPSPTCKYWNCALVSVSWRPATHWLQLPSETTCLVHLERSGASPNKNLGYIMQTFSFW